MVSTKHEQKKERAKEKKKEQKTKGDKKLKTCVVRFFFELVQKKIAQGNQLANPQG